ncbi:MAG: NADH-quinone oxidoreductase subunit N [Cyanobacteria bacterium NC_groundwater_1444_Ag_S-0.65um_54_12]|nr:NADH-quinone oxidoreductase subunit N [Cyanobacteria bacterium NC_groundwater_1444_Ag_S-0.65um_54_12]
MDYLPLMPFLVVTGGGLLSLLLMGPRKQTAAAIGRYTFTFGVLLTALLFALRQWFGQSGAFRLNFFGGAIVIDNFSTFFAILVLLCGLVTVLVALPYAHQERMDHPELHSLLLFAISGMLLLGSSKDLLVLFLGLEIMSLAIYALVGLRRHDLKANEATLKYILLGAFSSAFLLYGIALCYGFSGSTQLDRIATVISSLPPGSYPLYLLALSLLLAGLAFKIAAFPFHMWAPDVYEGAASPITGFMAAAVKVAAFAMLLRLALGELITGEFFAVNVIWWLSVLSMFVGNTLALVQQSVKRMLAYSSIAHTGYLLVGLTGVTTQQPDGATAALVYLVAYAITSIGAFACVTYLAQRNEQLLRLEDWAGMARRHPWIASAMTICLLSLIGFPPTVGFFGKYLLFSAAIQSGQLTLALLGILNSILAIWYYLRVVVVMMMKEPVTTGPVAPSEEKIAGKSLPPPGGLRWGAGIGAIYAALFLIWAGIGTFTLGIFPGAVPLFNWAWLSIASLL